MNPALIYRFLKGKSLTAWLALNGDLITLADGTRELVNSKGDNVVSTTGQMLSFNGTNEYITVTKDITAMKTLLFNFKDYDTSADYTFDNGGSFATSFVLRAEFNKFRLYYSEDGASSIWHDYSFTDWTSLERVGISITSTALNLYFNGLLVASFPSPYSDIYSSGTSYIMSRDNLDSFAKAKTGNIQIWHTPFDNQRMLFDYNYPELAFQLAFADEENMYLEEVIIPAYDALDPTHLLITTVNGEWTQTNFDEGTPYRHFYIEAGDYGATKINLNAVGTTRGEYTLSLHNGNDIHPASLLDAEQADCFFYIYGSHWTVDRVSAFGEKDGSNPSLRVVGGANNNIVNRWHCKDFKYGYQVYNRIGSWGMNNYNTLQNSYIHEQVDVIAGTAFDGIAMNLYAYGTDTIDTIGNKFVNNDVRNCGDAFQSTRTANNGDNTKNGEGTIVYNNRAWLTTDVYRDSDGTLNPLGEYSQTEEAIDLKFGSENPLNPMIIEKNMAFGFRAPIKDGASANSPIPFFTHFGVRNFKMNYNVSVENGGLISLISAEDYEAIGNISADTNLINPNDLSFRNAIHLSNATRGDVNENVVRNHATSTNGSGDAIGTAGSLLNSLDSNIIISSKDVVIGTTDTITNTWLYNHTGSDAGETTNVYATEAEANMSDFAFEYERYTTTPKIKIVKGVLSDTLSPHFGLAGSDLEVDKSIGKLVMLPLLEGESTPTEYVSNSVVDVTSFTDINTSWNLASGLSTGLQKIYFNDDMSKADTMHFSETQADQIVATIGEI